MIPKILHLYWDGKRPLSYLRYLTVYTFAYFNPSWMIWIHCPITEGGCGCWFDSLRLIPQVTMVMQSEEAFIVLNGIEYSKWVGAHKADFLRWKLLAEEGGVWSDFDILYFKPITEELYNSWGSVNLIKWSRANKKGIITSWYPIGFMASTGDADAKMFFGDLVVASCGQYNPELHQCIGSELLESEVSAHTPIGIKYMAPELIYPLGLLVGRNGYKKYFEPNGTALPSNSIGLHWFGGSFQAQVIEQRLTPGEMKELKRHSLVERVVSETMGLIQGELVCNEKI